MRKMDEMELYINQKGIKWSWAFLVFSLIIWIGYNFITKAQGVTIPSLLFGLQFLVYFIVTNVEKKKVDHSSGKMQVVMVLSIIILLLAFGAILYLLDIK